MSVALLNLFRLKGLFLFFDNQPSIEPVKKVYHDSHRADVPLNL
jgi:hypothetical protein